MPKKKAQHLLTKPVSESDLHYNFKILFATFRHLHQVKILSAQTIEKFYQENQQPLQNSEIVQPHKTIISTVSIADYLNDSLARGLAVFDYLYTSEELAKIQIVKLSNPGFETFETLILKLHRSTKWLLAIHGWRENKYLALRQTYLFSKLGFNIMTVDLPNSSTDKFFQPYFGYHASSGLASCVDFLRKTLGMTSYGVIGNSLGGTIALRYAEAVGYYDQQLKFVIDDCGFTNLLIELRYFFQQKTHREWWRVSYGLSKKFRQAFGYDPDKFRTGDHFAQISKLPILFIHGDEDDIVPPFNSANLYREKIKFEDPLLSEYLLIPHVKHTEAINQGHKEYVSGIVNFLKAIGEIK